MLQKNPGTPNPFEEHEKGVLARNDYVAHKRVHLVVRILREAGIDQQLEELDQDGRKGPQGGKALLTHFVVLVIMILLAMEGSPLIFENAAQMLHHRLLPETRALLGLTRPTTERRCYFLMQRGFTRFADLFNPMPGPLGKRMTMDEYVENDQNRDDVECAEAMTRLDKFTNDLLWAPINTCPEILDGWDGNVTIDATAFAVFSKKGQSQHRLFASIESDAGWYRRDSKHNVPDDPKMAKIAFWGYELHLVAPTVNTRPSRQQRFCKPVIGISQCKPSHDPAGNGLKALRAAFTRAAGRMLRGLVVADMGYFANATPESLAMPVRAMGMGIVTDYKKDQRGVQDGFAGAVQVDGNWACPAMPPNIKDASADFAYKRIDATTFAARMHSREIYLARRKARPDADGNTTWMCPAAGPQATILCALKPKDFAANQNKTGLLQTLPLYQPEFPDQFCTQGSVKFPPNAGAKFAQDLTYASKLWLWIYPIARNYIESVNAFLKDEHRFALGVAGRRRARGYTKQYLFATILVFTSNLERIDNFIHPDISDPKPAKERRRDITNGYRYDPKTGRGAAPTGIADGYETNEEFITDVNEAIDPDA